VIKHAAEAKAEAEIEEEPVSLYSVALQRQ